MTAQTDDVDRLARQVIVACQVITVALAKRPGAVAPAESDDAMTVLNNITRVLPMVMFAPARRQCDIALGFLALWRSVLSDEADLLWVDPDDREGE